MEKTIEINEIIEMTCKYFGKDTEEVIRRKTRKREIVQIRQTIC